MNRPTTLTMTHLALLMVALTFAWSATAQDLQSSIVSLWKVTSVANKLVPTGEIVHPFGEHPSGYSYLREAGM